ncbi:hypothetical protein ERHA55_53380 (plasmid) [Erwinia rhapontici]|nr:hypothetical protein ERHA55_53380 [Erwinia rhapontici]
MQAELPRECTRLIPEHSAISSIPISKEGAFKNTLHARARRGSSGIGALSDNGVVWRSHGAAAPTGNHHAAGRKESRYVNSVFKKLPDQWRYTKNLAMKGKAQALRSVRTNIGIQHSHRPAHVHGMGHTRRHPDCSEWWDGPVTPFSFDGDDTAGSISELSPQMAMPGEQFAISVVLLRHHQIERRVFVYITGIGLHGPILIIIDLKKKAGHTGRWHLCRILKEVFHNSRIRVASHAQKTHYPCHIGHGNMGDQLPNNQTWAGQN